MRKTLLIVCTAAVVFSCKAQDLGMLSIYLERLPPQPFAVRLVLEKMSLLGENAPNEISPLLREITGDLLTARQVLIAEPQVEAGRYDRLEAVLGVQVKWPTGDSSAMQFSRQEISVPLNTSIESGEARALFLQWQLSIFPDSLALFTSVLLPVRKKIPPATSLFYVSNEASGTVSILDRQSGEVTGSLRVGQAPRGMAISNARDLLFVANSQSNSISVIEIATQRFRETILLDFGDEPEALCLSRDDRRLFSANPGSGSLTVIDPDRATTINKIVVGQEPVDAATDPNRGNIWVVCSQNNEVQIIHPENYTALATLNTGFSPRAIAFNERSSTAYIANFNAGFITVAGTKDLSLVGQISAFPGIADIFCDPFRDVLYAVVESSSMLSVIKPALNLEISQTALPEKPGRMAVDPEGGNIFITSPGTNSINMINKNTGRIERVMATGQKPYMAAFP